MRTRDYRITRPLAAAVRAKGCPDCTKGWDTFANEACPVGFAAARWIRDSPFAFTELRGTAADALGAGVVTEGEIDARTDPATPVTIFRFHGGQPCFKHPGKPRFFAGQREHVKLADLIDDLDDHVGHLAEQLQRG